MKPLAKATERTEFKMQEQNEKLMVVTGNAEDTARQGNRRGWFVGHFLQPEELPVHTQAVELKWGVHTTGEEKQGVAVNNESTTLTILISGEFEVKFPIQNMTIKLAKQGDYVIFKNGISHTWKAVTDSVVLTVRWPSIPEDQVTLNDVDQKQHDPAQELLPQLTVLLDKVAEENRHRESEIMQGIDGEKAHAYAVLSWVRQLSETPSVELEIAALFHDIDRIVTPGVGGGFKGNRKSVDYINHKKAHARRSANFIYNELINLNVEPKLMERVTFLIQHHDDPYQEVEYINDRELNILVSADSFAFFTTIAPKLYEAEGEGRLRDKIKFMVEKMPRFTKQLLRSHYVENDIFERIKNEVFLELE